MNSGFSKDHCEPNWDIKGMEKRQMRGHRKAEVKWTWLSDGEAAAADRPNVLIIYRWAGRQDYCIKLNKKTYLANLGRSSLL